VLRGLNKDLVLRVKPEDYEEAIARPHARPMDFTGRPMRGFIYVSSAGLRSARDLGAWIQRSLRFVFSLAPLGVRTVSLLFGESRRLREMRVQAITSIVVYSQPG
jgi:hypothetical protein